MENNNKQIIFLPNFNIYSIFSNSVLGVFIAIFTGIMTEIIINNEWKIEHIIFFICCVFASVLLWIATRINNRVNELCQNMIVGDTENKLKSSNKVYEEFWNKKYTTTGKYQHRHLRIKFSVLLIASFTFVLGGAIFYFIKGQQQSTLVPAPTPCIQHNDSILYMHYQTYTLNFDTFKIQQLKTDSILNSKIDVTIKQNNKIIENQNKTKNSK